MFAIVVSDTRAGQDPEGVDSGLELHSEWNGLQLASENQQQSQEETDEEPDCD